MSEGPSNVVSLSAWREEREHRTSFREVAAESRDALAQGIVSLLETDDGRLLTLVETSDDGDHIAMNADQAEWLGMALIQNALEMRMRDQGLWRGVSKAPDATPEE